jgi:hypothetical protein
MPFLPKYEALAKDIAPGTQVHDCSQEDLINICKYEDVDVEGLKGACFELCRRYVFKILTGTFVPRETMRLVFYGPSDDKSGSKSGYLRDLVAKHKEVRNGADGNYDVTGLDRKASLERKKSCFQFTVLRSRKDVINYMYKNDGAYIYAFTNTFSVTDNTKGHVVAFSVEPDRLIFFDPNAGEISVPGSSKAIRDKFLAWWDKYWKWAYKDDFHNGERKLVKYSVSGSK